MVHRGSTVVKVLRYKSEGRWFDPSWCHWNSSLTSNPSDRTMALGVDSASNRNEYQEHLLGGKCGRCVRLTTLPPSCVAVMKSGDLNFLEPSGPLQACNGTALPFIRMVLYHLHTRPPALCKRGLVPLPTLILIIVLCYIYTASLINCIQPDDGHSSVGRNM